MYVDIYVYIYRLLLFVAGQADVLVGLPAQGDTAVARGETRPGPHAAGRAADDAWVGGGGGDTAGAYRSRVMSDPDL